VADATIVTGIFDCSREADSVLQRRRELRADLIAAENAELSRLFDDGTISARSPYTAGTGAPRGEGRRVAWEKFLLKIGYFPRSGGHWVHDGRIPSEGGPR
jgi:hypothetical protein